MTQCELIKASLEAGEILTPLVALTRFGCLSLSQRVGDLEKEGMLIEHALWASCLKGGDPHS